MTPRRSNLAGGAWLLADMSLNIWALSIVKAMGLDYPPAQIVFLRALTGLVLIAPWIWRDRARLRGVDDLSLHLLRVALSVTALAASFHAVARVPFALFSAVNFTRPLVIMVLAALLLGETIGPRRWAAAALALLGVLIAINPFNTPPTEGLATLFLAVLAGASATIVLRRLRDTHPLVLMTFYTVGLTLLTAPFAAAGWRPLEMEALLPLLCIGLFAQSAQLCFLRAHHLGEAGFLSVLGYLSLVLSTAVGYLVFGEVPRPGFFLGATLVIGAALWVTTAARRAAA
ncbi:S-adenosylmethionine uptake transporter [Aliiruegeria haliotis]|uniref:S-adenosylmethionine uptake transporter n=1 Tax=Aliiruegeria haliotis TaxID=1280846 RepID=A0A2T0RYE8_9RHOB|nr:DMT family transporter [Aliiruegeria haliotis]PRY26162.1 S-adenosylmethionine uptake transporter [Aliiruegeria haliotis]